VLEEVDDLHDLGLGALVAGDVAELRGRPILGIDLGLGLADAHDPAELLAAAAAEPDEDPDDQQERQERQDHGQHRGSARVGAPHLDLVLDEERGEGVVVQRRRDLGLVGGPAP
jgi:hypothetical protein